MAINSQLYYRLSVFDILNFVISLFENILLILSRGTAIKVPLNCWKWMQSQRW